MGALAPQFLWFRIERAATDCGEKPRDWCRTIVLETLKMRIGLTQSQRILFSQIVRTGFLVENGFTLLAEDTLESEHWKRHRAYARANLDVIAGRAFAEIRSKTQHS